MLRLSVNIAEDPYVLKIHICISYGCILFNIVMVVPLLVLLFRNLQAQLTLCVSFTINSLSCDSSTMTNHGYHMYFP